MTAILTLFEYSYKIQTEFFDLPLELQVALSATALSGTSVYTSFCGPEVSM